MRLFSEVIKTDKRNQNFGAYLHRATALIGESNDPGYREQAAAMLEQYVERYAQSVAADNRAKQQMYPPHLETVYDYMNRVGKDEWVPVALAKDASGNLLPVSVKALPIENMPNPQQSPAVPVMPGLRSETGFPEGADS